MDRITKEHRSWNMSRIRGKDTKLETLVRKFLYSQGFRYRIHARLPGKPDIVMKRRKLAVFINGCFWHAHQNCKDFQWPKTRDEFWRTKIESNVQRDQKNYTQLQESGWQVVIVWECNIKRNRENTLNQLLDRISNTDSVTKP